MTTPTLCVIIPSFRHFDYVFACLESLQATTPDACVLLLDDASPDYPYDRVLAWTRRPLTAAIRFDVHGGLTRSWNEGLRHARQLGIPYAVCGNSDLLFSPGWEQPLLRALDQGYKLVGPVSNTPGTTIGGRQDVAAWLAEYTLSDTPDSIATTAAKLLQCYGYTGYGSPLNGFCMMARTADWWEGAFDSQHVFNPANKMTGNEDELQARWRRRGWTTAVVPGSFVFHYRSVSRGERYKRGRWLRRQKETPT